MIVRNLTMKAIFNHEHNPALSPLKKKEVGRNPYILRDSLFGNIFLTRYIAFDILFFDNSPPIFCIQYYAIWYLWHLVLSFDIMCFDILRLCRYFAVLIFCDLHTLLLIFCFRYFMERQFRTLTLKTNVNMSIAYHEHYRTRLKVAV